MSAFVRTAALVLAAIAAPVSAQINPDELWETRGGKMKLELRKQVLLSYGVEVPIAEKSFTLDPKSKLLFYPKQDRVGFLFRSTMRGSGELILNVAADGTNRRFAAPTFIFALEGGGKFRGFIVDGVRDRVAFLITADPAGGDARTRSRFDKAAGRLTWDRLEVRIAGGWANAAQVPIPAETVIGYLSLDASCGPAASVPEGSGNHCNNCPGTANPAPAQPQPPVALEHHEPGHVNEDGPPHTHAKANPTGPDVIVGDLDDLARYGRENGITAFSVGTTSCNIGTQPLLWIADDNRHPVIGTTMYRLKAGRFEQIGLSWLKHGFFAVDGNLCFNDCQSDGSGDELGVHCSDPYSAGLNGDQANLGPRSQVNAATGFYPFPPADPPFNDTIGRRMQVKDADLDPARNQGAQYFIEGQYVAADDTRAGNGVNNTSYRRIRITTQGTNNWDMEFMPGEETHRQEPALFAWRRADPEVVIRGVDVPGDGHFDLAYRVTRNADQTWHYEFAVLNETSDRSGGSFSLPVPAAATVTNIGFHDVDHHSGEPFDGTDWQATRSGDTLTWRVNGTGQNANALRWGTTYNFRFDCDRAPAEGIGRIGLFKPGTPTQVETRILCPGGGGGDLVPPVFAGVRTVNPDGQGLRLTWNAAQDDVTPAAQLRYRVYLATTAGGQDFAQPVLTTGPGALEASVGGLDPQTRYFAIVRAVDAGSNEERNTVERSATTGGTALDVRAPTFAGAREALPRGPTRIEVRWNAAQDDTAAASAIRYKVYLATTSAAQDLDEPAATTLPGELRATIDGLQPGKRYFAVVRAVDPTGNEDLNTVERQATTATGVVPAPVKATLVRLSPQSARPGSRLQSQLTLQNTGDVEQVLTARYLLVGPNGWSRQLRQEEMRVPRQLTRRFTREDRIPTTAPLGEHQMFVTLTNASGVEVASLRVRLFGTAVNPGPITPSTGFVDVVDDGN